MKSKFSATARLLSVFATIALQITAFPLTASARQTRMSLFGHVPMEAMAASRSLGQVPSTQILSLALVLPLRNQADLADLVQGLYDPLDPRFGQYLTPREFQDRFSPTQADYNAVGSFAIQHGLRVIGVHPNRTLIDVEGSAAAVRTTFQVELNHYQHPDGRVFRAPTSEPTIPASVAGKMTGVIGLDTLAVYHPHLRELAAEDALNAPLAGTGPNGGYSPADIRAAYNLSAAHLTGAGQTLAVFELDGYNASDITAYENAYHLPHVPLQNVLIDGAKNVSGSGAAEVTLDIELQAALAPAAKGIVVYIGPNSTQGILDTFNQIVVDNVAKAISTSWGAPEAGNSQGALNAENAIFQQMAAQGQSIFAASGDTGAYDNGSVLGADDPAAQPYVCGVGGTRLTANGGGGAWQSETTWNDSIGAGGGGISQFWTLPTYQKGLNYTSFMGSSTARNVPDVSLNASPYTGYSIYFGGAWRVYGGTSCAAPLWSAFAALVNQQRLSAGNGLLGFANPALYNIGQSSSYANDFHDILDNSTNRYYHAVGGYDDATGLGSFNGLNLLNDLAPTAALSGNTATFVGADTTTQGNWVGKYGATGYNVIGDAFLLPTWM